MVGFLSTLDTALRALRRSAPAGLLALAGLAAAADIGINPVAVHLDKLNDRATVNVSNQGREPVVMQVEALSWRRSSGEDEHLPTADVVINPSVFTLAPGKTQLVRVGLRRQAPVDTEGTYRIVLREVPSQAAADAARVSGQVQVLMALRLPVYVAPAKVVRIASVEAVRHTDGEVLASIRNQGNVHIKVARLQLRSQDGEPVPGELTLGGSAAVLFPGEERTVRLRVASAAQAGPLMLEATTDQGAQQVPVSAPQVAR